MASTEPKISKLGAAGTTRHITLIITETLKIVMKPEVLQASVIMAAYKIELLTTHGIKKHKEKITCKNQGQNRCCLINGLFNNLAPFQSCGCKI